MAVYYNEFDKQAAAWLRELIAQGHLPDGDVDERDIREVEPGDLFIYDQCHFFAGIGGWALALEMASWPTDAPIWTGSCPCQPFSAAGKRKGTADERHLWPEFRRLIADCEPPVVFGEQVASKDGRRWLAGVRTDMEALGYGVGAADLCAPGAGAPHIRQRLWWVADSGSIQSRERGVSRGQESSRMPSGVRPSIRCPAHRMADTTDWEPRRARERQSSDGREELPTGGHVATGGLPDTSGQGLPTPQRETAIGAREEQQGRAVAELRDAQGHWIGAIWIDCADGKARRVEPRIHPLAHGVSGRVGLLRGYGNAIVPQVAATFIEAYLETQNL